jgi:hypothetical protein
MSRPIVTSVTLAAAVSNGVAQTQSLGSAGALVLNGSLASGGVATFDAPRRVIITSAGDDSGITWTITGPGRSQSTGQTPPTITETIQGANGIATSTQDFSGITSIVGSGATASTVTAGTSATGSGPWVVWSEFQTDFQVQIDGFVLSGSPTWQVDYTPDDVFGTWLPPNVPFPRAIAVAALTGKTGTASGALTTPVRATRLTLTVVGGVQLTQTQVGA